MAGRYRSWMFTIFGDLNDNWDKELITYLVGQYEICPTTKKKHFQGYLELDRACRIGQVKAALRDNSVHLEQRKGSQKDAITYVTKKDTSVEGTLYEYGIKKVQGKRNDLEYIVEQLRNKVDIKEIIEGDPSALKYIRHMKEYQAMLVPKREWETEVIVILGEAGTGKTRQVWENEPDLYVVPEATSTQFFDGYIGQEAALFDDFEGEIKYRQLLKLTDRYPMLVNTKGGMVNWCPKRIYITSNKEIEEWYMWEKLDPLIRRIKEVRRCGTEVAGNTQAATSR